MISVIEYHGELVVDSRLVASRLGIQHESFIKTIKKYRDKAEQRFGHLRFEIGGVTNSVGATNEVIFVYLTEQQSTFYMTLSKNTDAVVDLKADLVEAFFNAKQLIASHKTESASIGKVLEQAEELANWLTRMSSGKLDPTISLSAVLNSVGKQLPQYREALDTVKSTIVKQSPLENVEFTPTELAAKLSSKTGQKWSNRVVNQKLLELGLQTLVVGSKNKRWELTETGLQYGRAYLETANNNRWSGTQIKWSNKVINKLLEA